MKIKKSVVVTALYNIGRDEWDNYRLSYDHYFLWMKNTLSLNCEMVIYTENQFYDRIIEFRKGYDTDLTKTKIILMPLEDLVSYKLYYEKLNHLMNSDDFKKNISHQVPEMTKPLYNIIMFNKVMFLKHTKDMGYFGADLLIWADAGGLRDNLSKYENKNWPSLDKIDTDKITFFCHTTSFNITNNFFHSMSQIRHIQGTCFFVPSHMIDKLVSEFQETVDECILLNYIGSDEKIFDIVYCKNKLKYKLVVCTWRTYFDIFKFVDKVGQFKKIKLLTVTWGDYYDLTEASKIYQIEHLHFNSVEYEKLEIDFLKKCGSNGKEILYKFYLLMEESKKINSNYIIFCNPNQISKITEMDNLIVKFDSENKFLFNNHNKIIFSKTDIFIEMLQTVLYQILILDHKNFTGDNSIFGYYHNADLSPKIIIDSLNLLTLD